MRNLTNATINEFTEDSAVQMVSLATGELHGKAPISLFGSVEQYPTFGDFPAAGKENVLYVDQSQDPYQGYVWFNGAYEQLGGQNLDVVVAPISYVPTATGNTANLNEVVVDPNGDIWVIDYQGDAALLELAKHLDVLLDVQATPTPSGNTTNLATVFKDARGMTWVIDRKGDAIATGAPETVYYYGVDSETFPANPFTGDELLVTDTGDASGKILEQWLFDGNTWVQRPFTEPITMAGALLAAMACIGSPVLVPTGNTQDVQTVGAGGDHADLQAALTSADVVDGTILRLTGDQVLSTTLNVNKAVVIDLAGFKVDSTAAGPVTMFNMTAPLSVVKGGTINHLKTTNTSVESVFNLASADATKPVFVAGNTINAMEFGVVARGNYVVADNQFGYIGASQTNSHRYFGLYGNSGESRITGNKFTAITAATTRYTNFILMTSASGTVYSGKLYIDNNTQTGGNLRQFFLHEAGDAGGMELYVGNNTFDDLNGGIGILSPALYNSYSKIGIFSNTQGASAAGNFKGLFFVDGTGVLSDTVQLTYGGNTTAAGPLRADYVSLDAGSENLIAVKNTVTFTEQKTAPVVDEANLEALGELLQELKGRKTYIVDSEGQPIQGNGTETDPFVVASAGAAIPNTTSATSPSETDPTLNDAFKNQMVKVTAGENAGDIFYVDEDGVAVKLFDVAQGGSTVMLPVAFAIGTQAQLDAIPAEDRVANGYYILNDPSSTATSRGDILVWADTNEDGVGDEWQTAIVPKDGTEWVVLTNAAGNPAGNYTYGLTTDVWTRRSDIAPVIPPIDNPTAVGSVLFPSRHIPHQSNNGPVFIHYDEVTGFGQSTSQATSTGDNGGIGASARPDTIRKSPWTYYQQNSPYTQIVTYRPFFVDVQQNNTGAVALDHTGVLWYKGQASFMSAMQGTGSDSGISTVAAPAFTPDKFWADREVKVVKFFLSQNAANLMAVAGDGTVWMKTVNAAAGLNGDGTVTQDTKWHKVLVPQKAYKKIYIRDTFAFALGTDGVIHFWGTNTSNRFNTGATGAISTPVTPSALAGATVKDAAIDQNSSMLVDSDGARRAIGINTSGKFGNGGTTNLTVWTTLPSNGFVFDKVADFNWYANDAYAYITVDRRAVLTGYQNLNRGIAGKTSADNVTTPTLMGNGAYQGTVVDIRMFPSHTLIHTDQGEVWTATNASVAQGEYGTGINTVAGNNVGLNIFRKVPVPAPVLQVYSASGGASNTAVHTVLTTEGRVYSWGGEYGDLHNSQNYKRTPYEVLLPWPNGTPKKLEQEDLAGKVGSITSATVTSISAIKDTAGNQVVTATITAQGTAGSVDLTGSTVAGPNTTFATWGSPTAFMNGTTSTFTVSWTSTIADDPATAPGQTTSQPWTITLNNAGVPLSLTGTGDRTGIDLLRASLSAAEQATYDTLAPGQATPISAASYANIIAQVGAAKYGRADITLGFLGGTYPFTGNTTSLPAGSFDGTYFANDRYLVAFAVRSHTAPSGTYNGLKVKFSNNANSGFQDYATVVNSGGNVAVNTVTYFVVKPVAYKTPAANTTFATFRPTTAGPDVIGGSGYTSANYTTVTGDANSGLAASSASYVLGFGLQALMAPTKVWA